MMQESVTALRMAVLIDREVLAVPRLTERLRALNMEASRVGIILPEQTILFRRVWSSQLFIKDKQPDREAARVISSRRQAWLLPVDAPLQMKEPATLQNLTRSSIIQEPSGSKEACMVRRVKLLIAVQALMLAEKKYVAMLCRSHIEKIRLSCMNIPRRVLVLRMSYSAEWRNKDLKMSIKSTNLLEKLAKNNPLFRHPVIS
ncbi:Uncharacterised protein [Enterobacter hormaechei]|nr:Uncharacterised protein [Enterobacter hormaechei]